MGLVDDIVKPSECFLGMCLPVTREAFLACLQEGSNTSYAKIRRQVLNFNPEALWELDHLPLVQLFMKKKEELEKLGVTVCVNFNTRDVPQIENFKVATIFAHHDDSISQVEMADGLQPVTTIMEHFPDAYDKILDLTLCRSIPLQTAIRTRFKKCLVVANKLEANPEFRLLCYSKAISYLQSADMSYVDAISKVRISIINSMPKKNEFPGHN
jgi:hypothetical protein